ncbi:hypothetical protein MAPG_09702 [Magnaporthiopsis poae ATCC 64411]|uniref:Uncharacterized protein n=1 Tax=Magnaporthiopsis poae (strain ATCC 64411 / 73-15) TaxID=644358 RepID=A0A0C4EAM7_MAGP6|nr:hypothetical protein MAPG_09702 [Magnaporthiopsis poae ATCC 64411]
MTVGGVRMGMLDLCKIFVEVGAVPDMDMRPLQRRKHAEEERLVDGGRASGAPGWGTTMPMTIGTETCLESVDQCRAPWPAHGRHGHACARGTPGSRNCSSSLAVAGRSGRGTQPTCTSVLDGNTPNLETGCVEYEAVIQRAGGIGPFLAGIGKDEHIAFNEPDLSLASRTRLCRIGTTQVHVGLRRWIRHRASCPSARPRSRQASMAAPSLSSPFRPVDPPRQCGSLLPASVPCAPALPDKQGGGGTMHTALSNTDCRYVIKRGNTSGKRQTPPVRFWAGPLEQQQSRAGNQCSIGLPDLPLRPDRLLWAGAIPHNAGFCAASQPPLAYTIRSDGWLRRVGRESKCALCLTPGFQIEWHRDRSRQATVSALCGVLQATHTLMADGVKKARRRGERASRDQAVIDSYRSILETCVCERQRHKGPAGAMQRGERKRLESAGELGTCSYRVYLDKAGAAGSFVCGKVAGAYNLPESDEEEANQPRVPPTLNRELGACSAGIINHLIPASHIGYPQPNHGSEGGIEGIRKVSRISWQINVQPTWPSRCDTALVGHHTAHGTLWQLAPAETRSPLPTLLTPAGLARLTGGIKRKNPTHRGGRFRAYCSGSTAGERWGWKSPSPPQSDSGEHTDLVHVTLDDKTVSRQPAFWAKEGETLGAGGGGGGGHAGSRRPEVAPLGGGTREGGTGTGG